MNQHLAPKYQCRLKDHTVLWYETSNNYSIVESSFIHLLDYYFIAKNSADFRLILQEQFDFDVSESIRFEELINKKLEVANFYEFIEYVTPPIYDISQSSIKCSYYAFGKFFTIITNNSSVLQYVHPSISHLQTKRNKTANSVFYIHQDTKYLHLFLNKEHCGSFPKKNYHLLQGRFVMLLLGVLHHQNDNNWMASFHASTIAKNGNAVMLAGASGKGKSTLTALLAFNGFEFVADDVTGMLYPSCEVYSYPAAISVKAGAFQTLQESIPDLNNISLASKHPKGMVKFLPVTNQKSDHYPCHQLVMVNYSKEPIAARLEHIPTVKALELLIPDTWISADPSHAKTFLDWLPTLKAYELHYHNNTDAIEIMEGLFKS